MSDLPASHGRGSGRIDSPPWPELAVILFYLAIRLYHISLFPVFVDEVTYITWERSLARGDLAGAASAFMAGKPLLPWLFAPFSPLENGLWIARTAMALMGVPAMAALLRIGRTLFDRRVAISAGLVYSLLPFAFFFDRLMLSDPISADLCLVTLWLALVSVKGRRHRFAALTGALIGAGMLLKYSTLVIGAAPILVYWLLTPGRDRSIASLVRIYSIPTVIGAVLLFGLWEHTLFSIFVNMHFYVANDTPGLLPKIVSAASDYVTWMSIYIGAPLLLLAGGGFVWAAIRRDRPMILLGLYVILIDLLFIVVGSEPFARYYLLGTALLVLLACAAAWQVYRAIRQSLVPGRASWVSDAAMLGLAIVVAAPMISFIGLGYTAPQDLPLPTADRGDYIQNRYSGFAMLDAARWLKRYAQTDGPLTIIYANSLIRDRFDIYLFEEPGIQYADIEMVSPGWLADQTAERAVFLPEDGLGDRERFDALRSYHLELVGSYPRPGGETVYNLYRVTP